MLGWFTADISSQGRVILSLHLISHLHFLPHRVGKRSLVHYDVHGVLQGCDLLEAGRRVGNG
eukprot:767082-Hanusia_phi.AAC.1